DVKPSGQRAARTPGPPYSLAPRCGSIGPERSDPRTRRGVKERALDQLISLATSTEGASQQARVALLTVGSYEPSGEFLPLSTDTIVASAIAREIARMYPVALLPPITIACSHEHAAWSGTVSISARTLHLMITDVAESLSRNGVDRLVLVN